MIAAHLADEEPENPENLVKPVSGESGMRHYPEPQNLFCTFENPQPLQNPQNPFLATGYRLLATKFLNLKPQTSNPKL